MTSPVRLIWGPWAVGTGASAGALRAWPVDSPASAAMQGSPPARSRKREEVVWGDAFASSYVGSAEEVM